MSYNKQKTPQKRCLYKSINCNPNKLRKDGEYRYKQIIGIKILKSS